MGRPPCSKEEGVKKGPWTAEEDKKLIEYIEKNGHGSWRALPKLAGLNRCGKSCRLRWTNYLRPDIKRGKFSEEEERLIIHLHSILGNKWSAIATNLPGRTDNEIKNYWNTHLRKHLLRMGIDPVTHRPRADLSLLANLPAFAFPSAADPLAGLELLLQGLVQTLLAPSYLNNLDVRSNLYSRPEFQSSLQRVDDVYGQIPALASSPEIVSSEFSQAMVNSGGDSAGASQPWRYSSDATSESDYCWDDILASIPTAL